MRYGTIPGIDKPVSRLVQGTAMIGGGDEAWEEALLDAVFEQGCTAFDTAHQYGGGANERAVGRWIASRGVRDRVVIVGKGAHHDRDRRRVTPDDIDADLLDSLARFEVDAIDLYLLHRDDPAVPVGEIVEALDAHRRAGRIGAYGGSNWSHERVREANAWAEAHGHAPFAVSSPNFSLAVQLRPPWEDCLSIGGPGGEAARRFYREAGIPILAWSSLAGGFFSGRYDRGAPAEPTDDDRFCLDVYGSDANFARLGRARSLAEARGLTVAQVALAYVLNAPLEVYPLVGCRSTEEFRANAAALEVVLDDADLRWLESGEGAPSA